MTREHTPFDRILADRRRRLRDRRLAQAGLYVAQVLTFATFLLGVAALLWAARGLA